MAAPAQGGGLPPGLSLARFRREQKRSNIFFREVRRGVNRTWTRLHRQVADMMPDVFPRPGGPGFWAPPPAQAPIPYALQGPGPLLPPAFGANPPAANLIPRIRRLTALARPHRLRFAKFLGGGGFGIACLFNHETYRGTSTGHRYVIKRIKNIRAARGLADLEDERALHKRFTRAQHIVQLKHPLGAGAFDTMPGHILTEWCPRGDMWDFLAHIGQVNAYPIDEDILWNIFHCLTKGLVGMEYPPLENLPLKRYPNSQPSLTQPAVSERIPTRPPDARDPVSSGLIHFDLDPQNILIGGVNEGPANDRHTVVPRFKISDFGLTLEVRQADRHRVKFMWWECRVRGKPRYYTPEQFSEEWEYVDMAPVNTVVAGNFSEKTNIFAIGLIMAVAITGNEIPTTREHPGAGVPQELDIPDRHPAGVNAPTKLSYGAWLNDVAWHNAATGRPFVSGRLKRLVQWCLCERPMDRPDLWDLLGRIETRLLNRTASPNYVSAATVNQTFGFPLAKPPTRKAQDVTDWMNGQLNTRQFRRQHPLG